MAKRTWTLYLTLSTLLFSNLCVETDLLARYTSSSNTLSKKQMLIALLRKGCSKWNAWRVKNPRKKIDLSGANLKGIVLGACDLSHVNFFKADLRMSRFKKTNFRFARFNFALLNSSTFDGANLKGVRGEEAILSQASLKHVSLQGATFKGADFQGASLVYVRAQGVDFSGAKLTRGRLKHCSFQGANLQKANFSWGKLDSSKFQRANFKRAKLKGIQANYSSFRDTDFRKADFSLTRVYSSGFERADLRGANLRHFELVFGRWRDAKLQNADLRGAVLTENQWKMHKKALGRKILCMSAYRPRGNASRAGVCFYWHRYPKGHIYWKKQLRRTRPKRPVYCPKVLKAPIVRFARLKKEGVCPWSTYSNNSTP